MADTKDYKAWLILAEDEFNYASKDLEDPRSALFALTCFHFQQAAEKYLKAYLLFKKKSFRKVHNLIELAKLCKLIDKSFKSLRKETALLNPYYTETRYPVHWPMVFTEEDAKLARLASEKIKKFVEDRIS